MRASPLMRTTTGLPYPNSPMSMVYNSVWYIDRLAVSTRPIEQVLFLSREDRVARGVAESVFFILADKLNYVKEIGARIFYSLS